MNVFHQNHPRQILWQIVSCALSGASLRCRTVSAVTGGETLIGASEPFGHAGNPLRAATQNNVSRADGSPLHELFSTLMVIKVQQ